MQISNLYKPIDKTSPNCIWWGLLWRNFSILETTGPKVDVNCTFKLDKVSICWRLG